MNAPVCLSAGQIAAQTCILLFAVQGLEEETAAHWACTLEKHIHMAC